MEILQAGGVGRGVGQDMRWDVGVKKESMMRTFRCDAKQLAATACVPCFSVIEAVEMTFEEICQMCEEKTGTEGADFTKFPFFLPTFHKFLQTSSPHRETGGANTPLRKRGVYKLH